MEIKQLKFIQNLLLHKEKTLIYRFNALWKKTKDLLEWIDSNWPKDCKVSLCSKGFFLVNFPSREDILSVSRKGPWFWGSDGIFITPWFLNFDPLTMVVMKVPIWVRIPNLPLHYWTQSIFEGIGNDLGFFLSSNDTHVAEGLFTYARIYATIDTNSGLLEKINLKLGKSIWSQALDYENTSFRCKIY